MQTTTAELIQRLRDLGELEAAARLQALHSAYKHWKRTARAERVTHYGQLLRAFNASKIVAMEQDIKELNARVDALTPR